MPPIKTRIIRRTPRPAASYEEEPEEEEEDEAPVQSRRSREQVGEKSRRPKGKQAEAPVEEGLMGSGWGGSRQVKETVRSDFAPTVKLNLNDDPILLKFLEDGPVLSWKQHWCDWIKEGKKSFVCRGSECPLCAIHHRASYREAFNVVDFTDPEQPKNAVLQVGIRESNTLKKLNDDRRSGPLVSPERYYAISRSGDSKKPSTIQTSISAVKVRDLDEDWDMDPLSEEELEAYKARAYEKDQITNFSTMAEMEAAAESAD